MVEVKKISENVWEVKKTGKMKVPGIVFASEELMKKIQTDKTLEQVENVAQLPGIVEKSLAMPDAHMGYGFSIGGVAAFDSEKGIVSPGGVGYDINCGVRLLRTNLSKEEFLKKRTKLIEEIYKLVPSGVGRKSEFSLGEKEVRKVMSEGVEWAIKKGYGNKKDQDKCEDNGCIKNSDASKISPKAIGRGRNQLGTLGAGNHFLEIQEVEELYDKETAKKYGLKEKKICIMIHTGSRGLGHQVASDYIHKMEKEYGYENLPDRELICAPIKSELGQEYIQAMNAAANFAFVNRHLIMHQTRRAFEKVYGEVKIDLVYDIAHNIAKFEEFKINGKKKTLCVHRKGATRSFGPGRKEIPKSYQEVGCPIFIPGSMGTHSYVLAGTKKAAEISFASTAHGAGRVMSRSGAMKSLNAKDIRKDLEEQNIELKAGSDKGIVQEAPQAYKDVTEVVRVSNDLGIGKMVAKLKPVAVIKG